MTTTIYRVAYPHPFLEPEDRISICSIDPKTYRRNLLAQLYEEYPKHIEDLKKATIWKASDLSIAEVCSDSMRGVHDWINRKDASAEIFRYKLLVNSFPDGPHEELLEKVDIVVVTPEIEEAMQGDVGNLRYMKAREALYKAIKVAPSPSDSVESAGAIEETVSDPSGPRYGRPSDRYGPPTALFSEPLAFLKYNLEHLESFTPDFLTVDRAYDLVTHSANFFNEESDRERSLQHTLPPLLVGRNEWQRLTTDKEAKLGGVWLEGCFAYLIVELKNELGLGGDPFLQGLITYGKIITQKEYAPYLKRSNFPAILLSFTGNRLIVSTAIFTNAIYADELLSITLHLGPHGSDNILHVARVFMAINESTRRLRQLYRNLLGARNPSSQQAEALWPNPILDPPESTGRLPKLEFFSKVNRDDGAELSFIDSENERHGMYLARMQTGTPDQVVLVKFAAKYNQEAHRLLAGQNPPLAPALYFCRRVVGGMYMVIMEYIAKPRGWPIDSISSTRDLLPPPVPEVVRRDVTKALGLLHKENFVFGDLREANLLYLPEDGGRVLLIDFDGVGLDGVGRYSACLNPEAELGVNRWQIMEKEHDNRNFERLMERMSN